MFSFMNDRFWCLVFAGVVTIVVHIFQQVPDVGKRYGNQGHQRSTE